MVRSSRSRTAALVLANLLLPVAVLVFASGFFPYKPVLPGLATFENGEAGAEPPFDRVVFMVVDALRSDFVYGYGSGMEFTQSLIRSGAAVPFTAHATPPTVTMPRVKALTTGSVPSFLDLILNFAESDTSSSLSAQDTWLAQIRARGGNIVFYGDDTWLKLFPEPAFFLRHDGTSSFFVSDFTEVDFNVTRHVPDELKRRDWDAMIMHYLGLDHIGHKTGPQGPNMLPKQREMDGIVKMIYEAMEQEEHHKNTLLVLAGDHGMNAGGNHGGSGPGETEPALVFVSPKFRKLKGRSYDCPTRPKEGTEFHFYTKIEQSDLVPTLAGMMGLPISRNSLGVFPTELFGVLGDEQNLALLQRNAQQVVQIIQATYGQNAWQAKVADSQQAPLSKPPSCEDQAEGVERLACLWADIEADTRTPGSAQKPAATVRFLLEAQDTLSGTASSYNIPRMLTGMGLMAVIILLALFSCPVLWPPSIASIFFALTTILYGVMMFASSYVEEEQQFWYWLTPAWIFLLSSITASKAQDRRNKVSVALAGIAMLAVHRLSIRWNQTGQKHAGDPDIVHNVFPHMHVSMWVLVLAAYCYNGQNLARRAFAGIMAPEIAVLLSAIMVVAAVVFKLNFTQADAPELVQGLAAQIREATQSLDLVFQARVTFTLLAVATMVVVALSVLSHRQSKAAGMSETGLLPSLSERLHHLLTLFLITQTRAPNIPLFLGFEAQRAALAYILDLQAPAKERLVVSIATTTVLLSHVYFYCMGGSNSISSIDLSNAYNGVADYNIVAVGVLLFASNWTAPLWWCSAANLLLTPRARTAQGKSQLANGKTWIDSERAKLHADTLKAMMGPAKEATLQKSLPQDMWASYVSALTVFVSTSLLAVMAACTALRTHLFIWTVFSPKYLYAMAWSMGWHLIVNIGFGSLMHSLAAVA